MPASIQASAISHIALCVRDLERSLQFYRDGLGFQVTKDEVQDTSRGGLPHLYHDRHARRRVVHLRYGEAQSLPFLVLTEHPGDTVSGAPIMLDQIGISHMSFAQFLALCSRSKWSKHFTNSPFLALLAMDGSKAAYKIISACSHAVS